MKILQSVNTVIIGSNKATIMIVLVMCQDPVMTQLPEVSIAIIPFLFFLYYPFLTFEEMPILTLEMIKCMT